MSKKLFYGLILMVCFLLPMLLISCDIIGMSNIHIFTVVLGQHGHGRYPMHDYESNRILSILFEGEAAWAPIEGMNESKVPGNQAIASTNLDFDPDFDSYLTPSATDAFTNSVFDGLWMGRLTLTTPKLQGELGQFPFMLNINAQKKGKTAVGVLVLHIGKTTQTKSLKWEGVYTSDAKISGNKLTLSFKTDALTSNFPVDEKITCTINVTINSDLMAGTYTTTSKKSLNGKVGLFRMDQSKPLQGVWSSGFMAQIYAGELLDPPLYQPISLSINMNGNVPVVNQHILFFTKSCEHESFNNKVLKYDYDTRNGNVDAQFTLNGKSLNGKIWDHLLRKYYNFQMKPAGTKGLPVTVRKTSPKKLSFKKSVSPGKTAKPKDLKIVGKNFAPGAIVHFDNHNIEIVSTTFVNARQLKLKVTSIGPIKKNTKVGVKVINPDLQQGIKKSALKVK